MKVIIRGSGCTCCSGCSRDLFFLIAGEYAPNKKKGLQGYAHPLIHKQFLAVVGTTIGDVIDSVLLLDP